MTLDGWITLAILSMTLLSLSLSRISPDLILAGALTLLLVTGVLPVEAALAGFSNPGLWTVAALFVVVAGLVDTGAVHALGQRLLGRPKSVAAAQVRLMLPVMGMSAFLNNTPVVAMLVPVVQDWCRRHHLSVSKLMIPLSYAAILGGTCTLIGTSTNLVVNGLVQTRTDLGEIGFFELARVGIPSGLFGLAYILILSRWLLPERKPPLAEAENSREYWIEMVVQPDSPIAGKTIEAAGLRHLPGAFVAEIERQGSTIPAVSPREMVRAGDRLLFVGAVESVADLMRLKGLVPAQNQVFKLDTPRPERRFYEVVISGSSPVTGKTIREGRFRSRYNAVVIAAARNGERVKGKVGDMVLRPGDTLLLEARPQFLVQQRSSRDFLLVSEIQDAAAPRHDRAGLSLGILAAVILAASSSIMPILHAALLGAGLMILTRCTTGPSARASIDWSLLIVIGASLGLGEALSRSGAATVIAQAWMGLAGDSPWLALFAIYAITSFFTEIITNNAAAVLAFPLAQATAMGLDVSLWPFIIAIMMAASASFATPIGYQTNMMVYGPGGYRFSDYLRIGLPLNILLAIVAVLIIPFIWPF